MIEANIKGIDLKFHTDEAVFSPKGIDLGTLSMLSQVEFESEDKVLDLGCGYGVVGILASKIIDSENVVMCDISKEAILLTRQNLILNGIENVEVICSNGLDKIEESDFTLILSNPPYHVDFSVPKNFIEKGFQKLTISGKMVMVTKRKDWYKNKLVSVFGGVQIIETNGYFVFIAQKREKKSGSKTRNTNKLSKKLMRKQIKKNKKKSNANKN